MLALIISFFLLSSPARAGEAGYVKLPDGHEVYVDYDAPRDGKPTFVLVNGLVYGLDRWATLANPLAEQGYGVLRYYFRGQLTTLRRELQKGRPDFFQSGLSLQGFARELSDLMQALSIDRATIVGLSYGASIAAEFGQAYPEKTDQLVLLAPLVIPLDRYEPAGAWIRWNLDAVRLSWGPLWGPYVFDFYYNLIYRSYMQTRLVPDRIPEEMKDIPNEYKEAIFHQVRATRDFDLRAYRFPQLANRVHLVLASEEEEPALKDQFRSWRAFGKSGASLTYLSPCWHAVPDSAGGFTAELLREIAGSSPRFQGGAAFYADPKAKTISPVESDAALEARALAEPRGKKE